MSIPRYAIYNASRIHRYGVFALENIEPGALLWRRADDYIESLLEIQKIPAELRDRLRMWGRRIYLYSMNHSCEPNGWWAQNGDLLARRKIQRGEEITYDYADLEVGYTWQAQWTCACGSGVCRKIITSRGLLEPTLALRPLKTQQPANCPPR